MFKRKQKPFMSLSARQKRRRIEEEMKKYETNQLDEGETSNYLQDLQNDCPQLEDGFQQSILGEDNSDNDDIPIIKEEVLVTPALDFDPELNWSHDPQHDHYQVLEEIRTDIEFLKKKTLENNILLKELFSKLVPHQPLPNPVSVVPPSPPLRPVPPSLRPISRPAETVEELSAMCENVENLNSYLVTLKESTLSRTITSMMKVLMTRQLALKFSLTGRDCKRKNNKIKFKDSPACLLIEESLSEIHEYSYESRNSVHRSIGIVLKNASDWHGHRGSRKDREKTPEANGNDVPPQNGTS